MIWVTKLVWAEVKQNLGLGKVISFTSRCFYSKYLSLLLTSLYIKRDVKGFLQNLRFVFNFLLGGEKKQFDDPGAQ